MCRTGSHLQGIEPTCLQEVLGPLASRLQPLLSLRSESQVRLYAPGRLRGGGRRTREATEPTIEQRAAAVEQPSSEAVSRDVNQTGRFTLLREDELPFFADLDGWSLGFGRSGSGHVHPLSPDPHLIPERLLHFVAYVPSLRRQPMLIAGEPPSSGYVMPGWGAVGLVNPLQPASQLAQKDLASYFGLFAHQFRELVGLAEREPHFELSVHAPAYLPPGKQVVADWEIDGLMAMRFEHLIRDTARAVVTLLDLVRPTCTDTEALRQRRRRPNCSNCVVQRSKAGVLAGRGAFKFRDSSYDWRQGWRGSGAHGRGADGGCT